MATDVYPPYQKLRQTETPEPLKGRLTAKPSGKFCIPIPMAKFLSMNNNPSVRLSRTHAFYLTQYLALSRVAFGDFPIAPNPTPTANPSTSGLRQLLFIHTYRTVIY